jgi:hypothetical protein
MKIPSDIRLHVDRFSKAERRPRLVNSLLRETWTEDVVAEMELPIDAVPNTFPKKRSRDRACGKAILLASVLLVTTPPFLVSFYGRPNQTRMSVSFCSPH